ncbi:Uncharacterised protein [Mycobacteroides abscessus]|nr:Uncharacterised protein [Mycobacteroides abscessus]
MDVGLPPGQIKGRQRVSVDTWRIAVDREKAWSRIGIGEHQDHVGARAVGNMLGVAGELPAVGIGFGRHGDRVR